MFIYGKKSCETCDWGYESLQIVANFYDNNRNFAIQYGGKCYNCIKFATTIQVVIRNVTSVCSPKVRESCVSATPEFFFFFRRMVFFKINSINKLNRTI